MNNLIPFRLFLVRYSRFDSLSEQTNQDNNMSIVFESTSSDTVVVRMAASLDYRNAQDFKRLAQEYLENGICNFILDLSKTGHVDSTWLGSLYFLYRRVRPIGGCIVFSQPSRPVEAYMRLAKAFRIFPQFSSPDDARLQLLRYSGTAQNAVV